MQKAIEKEQVVLDHDGKTAYTYDPLMYDYKFGTVGAVALDKAGNLAAGTSTGGMTNKRYGRVGDSPLIGAGTYADNNTVAVSATGSGEKFIRTATAYNIASQVKYNKTPLATAANNALDEVKAIDGSGGVIVLDAKVTTPWPLTPLGCTAAQLVTMVRKRLPFLVSKFALVSV